MRGRFKKIRKRRFKIRKRKSILRNRSFWGSFLAAFLSALIFHLFFISDAFKIKNVEILTPQDIPQDEFQDILRTELETPFLYFFQKDSFFLIDTKKIEEKILENYPVIREANLKRKFPRGLTLEIKKRKAVATCCLENGNCFLIDTKGIIFRGSTSGDLVTISIENGKSKNPGEQVISEERMDQILRIQNELGKNLQIHVEKFTLTGKERLNVKTTEHWEIYFDLSGDINFALTKLNLLLEKEISPEARESLQYIDLRFSKVYYK